MRISHGQISATSDENDQAYIQLVVCMKGMEITVTAPAASDGNNQTVGITWSAWAVGTEDMPGDALDRDATEVLPCVVIHQVLWLENTGGVTADIAIDDRYSRTALGSSLPAPDGDWSVVHHGAVDPAYFWCVGLTEDKYKFGTAFTPSTGSAAHVFPAAVAYDMSNAPHVDVVNNLIAHDISEPEDGIWTAGATDQQDIDLVIVVPPSISCVDGTPDKNSIILEIKAELAISD